MAIDGVNTLGSVSRTKRVPAAVLEHFGRELARWVNENFAGNQTHAARVLGVTQSHVSAMISGDRGPGLNTLILMRSKTGKSVDELLGLGPAPPEHLTEQLRASFELEVARFRADAKRTLEEANQKLAEAADIDAKKARRPRNSKRRA
jgi:predicted transcriptional regulator